MLALGSNTVHLLLPELQSQTKIPFTSIIELVSAVIRHDHVEKVGLVCSTMTRNSNLYGQVLAKSQIQVILPTSVEQLIIDQVIRSVLAGKVITNLLNTYRQILARLIKSGAKSIILGCTELPLALDYEEMGIPVYNCVKILAQDLTSQYYKELN